MENALYPLKFTPILKDKIWGGPRLKKVMNKTEASDKCGESWEISGVAGDVSVVKNGFLAGNSLEEIVEIYMGDLVGEKVYEKFGNEFPLLIKFIDASDDLSVQVHPDDDLSKKRHNAFGKTEMWYIIDTVDETKLIVGFNRDVTKEEYIEHVKNESLPEIMNFEHIKPGDVYFIPAGRVHAIGAGALLAEVQQTSDVTYRIYDYNRKDDKGNPRELHTEMAVDAIDYSCESNYKTEYQTVKNKTSNIVDCKYFTTGIIEFDSIISKDYNLLDSFIIYICIEGESNFEYNGEKVGIKKGETVLIPADLKNLDINPVIPTKLLEVYIK